MKMVLFSVDEADVTHLFEQAATANTMMTTGTCPAKNSMSAIPKPTAAGACYTLTFPTTNASTTDFHLTIDTTGVEHVAFFTAHMPIEFERDTHYLMDGTCANAAEMAAATVPGATVANCAPAEPAQKLGAEAAHDHGRRLAVATKGAKGVTNRKSIGQRRLVNAGTCCTDSAQRGAWKQVVAYHDLCEHDQVPTEIEKGFHDYEESCEDYFCNLVGPDVDQTKCPISPPPPPTLPPAPSPPAKEVSTGIEEGTLIGVIVAAVVVAFILLFAVFCLVTKEKAGKPLFSNLEVRPDPKA